MSIEKITNVPQIQQFSQIPKSTDSLVFKDDNIQSFGIKQTVIDTKT